MELYKHKKTGKFFIFLDNVDDKFLLVTPEARIIEQTPQSFEEPIETDAPLDYVTDLQIRKQKTYVDNQNESKLEMLMEAFEGFSANEKELVLKALSKKGK